MIEDDAVLVDVTVSDKQTIEILDLLSSVSVEQLQIIRNCMIIQMFFDELAQNRQVLKN